MSMSTDAGRPVSGKRKRPWFQFSLRTLLVLMLALGCGLGWLGYKRNKAFRRQVAVEVFCDWRLARGPGSEKDPALWGTTLYLSESPVTDSQLTHVAWLPDLEVLHLESTGITDRGLASVRRLTRLSKLSLGNARVTDAGLVHLRRLKQLELLDLGNTHVTDAGLDNLRGLRQLKRLYLNDTQVTDAGLEHLRGLTQLLFLDLDSTPVTEAGVSELEKALPSCSMRALTRKVE